MPGVRTALQSSGTHTEMLSPYGPSTAALSALVTMLVALSRAEDAERACPTRPLPTQGQGWLEVDQPPRHHPMPWTAWGRLSAGAKSPLGRPAQPLFQTASHLHPTARRVFPSSLRASPSMADPDPDRETKRQQVLPAGTLSRRHCLSSEE